jgi:tetratricopeptide (TPR) repeat protein
MLLALALLAQAGHCEAGAELFRKGDWAGAQRQVRAALEQRSTPYCEKVMGVLYAAAQEYRKAEPHFAKACAEAPQEIDACYFWARALYSLDRFEESLRALERAEGATLEWKLRTARGQAWDALGNEGAEGELRRAMEAKKKDPRPPGEVDPLLALGSFLYRQGRGTEALTLLENATGYERVAPYHYQLGKALLSEGQLERAVQALLRAVELQPAYPEAHGLLSRAYERLDLPERARAHKARAQAR